MKIHKDLFTYSVCLNADVQMNQHNVDASIGRLAIACVARIQNKDSDKSLDLQPCMVV